MEPRKSTPPYGPLTVEAKVACVDDGLSLVFRGEVVQLRDLAWVGLGATERERWAF